MELCQQVLRMTDGLWDGNMSFLPGLLVFMTYHTHYLFICEIRARAEGYLGYHLSRPALRISHVKESCYSFSAPAECSVIVEALNTAVSITICGVTTAENRHDSLPAPRRKTENHTTYHLSQTARSLVHSRPALSHRLLIKRRPR